MFRMNHEEYNAMKVSVDRIILIMRFKTIAHKKMTQNITEILQKK